MALALTALQQDASGGQRALVPSGLPPAIAVSAPPSALATAPPVPVRLPESRLQAAVRAEHRTVADLPQKSQARLREIERFMREASLRIRRGMTLEQAAAAVRLASAPAYPILSRGRRGKSQLTRDNLRQWLGQLGRDARTGERNWANLVACADGYSRGNRGRRGSDEFWQELFRRWASENGKPLTAVHRDVCRDWRKLHLDETPPGLGHVSYQVRRYADKLAVLLGREGETRFRNLVMGYIRRDWSGVQVGEVWIADHRITDFLIKSWDPDGTPHPRRVWSTMIRDARSGKILAAILYPADEHPDSDAIIQCFYLAVQASDFIPPLYFYIDNGKDFCAQGFTTPLVISGVEFSICATMGVGIIRAIKFNPRAKLIERTFRDFADDFDRDWPTYIGNRPDHRPEKVFAWAREHFSELPSLYQAHEYLELWSGEYELRLTDSRVTGGRPTAELWANRLRLREPFTPAELRTAMLRPRAATRKVQRTAGGPGVLWANWDYAPEDPGAFGAAHWGTDVLIKTDVMAPMVRDQHREFPAWIYAAALDGRLIGKLNATGVQPALVRSEAEGERLSAAMRDVRTLLPETRRALCAMTGAPKPMAPMQAAAQLYARHGRAARLPSDVPAPAAALPAPARAESAPAIDPAVRAAVAKAIFGGRADPDQPPATASDHAGADAAADQLIQDALANLEV